MKRHKQVSRSRSHPPQFWLGKYLKGCSGSFAKLKFPLHSPAELNEVERKMVHESGAQLPGPGVGLDLNGVTIDKTCRDGAGVSAGARCWEYCDRHSLLLWKCQIILPLGDLYFLQKSSVAK